MMKKSRKGGMIRNHKEIQEDKGMSYLNQVTGYRGDLLLNRSVVKKGMYALLEPDGLVKNTIPGFEGCDVTILASPALGASFVDYLVSIAPGGGNRKGFGGDVESFFYLFDGSVKVWNEEEEAVIVRKAEGCILRTQVRAPLMVFCIRENIFRWKERKPIRYWVIFMRFRGKNMKECRMCL